MKESQTDLVSAMLFRLVYEGNEYCSNFIANSNNRFIVYFQSNSQYRTVFVGENKQHRSSSFLQNRFQHS